MTRRTMGLPVIFALAILVAPLASTAQPQRHVPLIGVFRPGYASADAPPDSSYSVFRHGLRDLGYVEGQTIRLEYRSGEWQLDHLPALAAELVRLRPDVLVTNTTCGGRLYAEAGCLVSYSANHQELFRCAAVFVDKILKGAKPAELPVELPSKFELFLNLNTAQALGLTMPPSLLFQATDVIR